MDALRAFSDCDDVIVVVDFRGVGVGADWEQRGRRVDWGRCLRKKEKLQVGNRKREHVPLEGNL